MRKIVTSLWFDHEAQEAVSFYTSLFEDSKILETSYITETLAKEAHLKQGDISAIDFELCSQNFTALNGGPMFTFSEAISILVSCKDQKEIDYLWGKLIDQGEAIACGWLKDKYGLTWQIVPENLDAMLRDPNTEIADRVSKAMLAMPGKLDMSVLEKAYKGD